MTPAVRLLLLSNSRTGDAPFLAHALAPLAAHFTGARRLAFVPYAGVTVGWDDYTARVAAALTPLGLAVAGVHAADDPRAALVAADGVLVGGGNTFHLLAHLHRTGLVEAIRTRVRGGMPYAGWSAGAVVSGPTLGTTNDMPIVQPASHEALALVPFHVNAHFTDAHPAGFRGETRRERLAEFVAVNPGVAVVGLPEGDWLEVGEGRVTLRGPHAAPIFRAGADAETVAPGEECSGRLAARAAPTAPALSAPPSV